MTKRKGQRSKSKRQTHTISSKVPIKASSTGSRTKTRMPRDKPLEYDDGPLVWVRPAFLPHFQEAIFEWMQ